MASEVRYVIITPARDEGEFIERTIKSVGAQTVKPIEWMIVNDGSSDNTGEIIERAAKQHPWISVLHRKDRGFRNSAGGEVDAFYDGFNRLKSKNVDFIVKLDADLSFNKDYFEKCFEYFRNIPDLGMAGGMIYHNIKGKLVLDTHPQFHIRGATKIYKKECWSKIGGILNIPGWDTIDEVKANMLGWKTISFPDLPLVQHRFTGAPVGLWRDSMKNGLANYISGYHPVFMLFKCLKRIINKPYFIGSLGLFIGFASGYLKGTPKVEDKAVINYLRTQQIRRMLFRPSIWK